MASVATWADSYRYTTAGSFSAPFHYIDAQDSPPDSCGVDYDRDCGTTGCVVAAIQNYTNILLDGTASKTVLNQALMFVIHFVGDIHQPLHDENLEVGGNDIDVEYNGKSTNLHAVWDTSMLEELAGGSGLTAASSWSAKLIKDIQTGSTGWSPTSWTSGIDITDPVGTSMTWADQANAYVCSAVIPDGVPAVEGIDLSGTYYKTENHVVTIQIARAGYRLAAWLNLIATGTTGGL